MTDQKFVSDDSVVDPSLTSLSQGLQPSAIEDGIIGVPNNNGSNPSFLRRNSSQPDIKTDSIPSAALFSISTTVSPVSSPGSPTQDEARRALELVMSYFQNQPSGLGKQEFNTIGKMMEKLELAQQSQNQALNQCQVSKLERIDEQGDFPPRVTKKRSIHTL